jgi:hypothetical protein
MDHLAAEKTFCAYLCAQLFMTIGWRQLDKPVVLL